MGNVVMMGYLLFPNIAGVIGRREASVGVVDMGEGLAKENK